MITYDVGVGEQIVHACEELRRIATESHMEAGMVFNGILVSAKPGESISDIWRSWRDELDRRRASRLRNKVTPRTQQERVLDYMLNVWPSWHTLAEISEYMQANGKRIPEASVSARLRQFATWRGGRYRMDALRPAHKGGQWRYRVTDTGRSTE